MLLDMGGVRLASSLVRGHVLHTGASLTTASRRDARCFARLRRVVAKRGVGPLAIGADTLGSD